MDSSPKFLSNERETMFPATNQLSSRRSQSFSSLSTCSSSLESSFSGGSPTNPAATPPQFSGIPFSWEKTPGIPKKQTSRKTENSSLNLLPLPPSNTSIPSKRFNYQDQETSMTRKMKNNVISEGFRRDPFFAAFVECCKEEGGQETVLPNIWKSGKVQRNLSDRLGLINMYSSCKRTCAISESIIMVPRSSRSSYHLLNRRSD